MAGKAALITGASSGIGYAIAEVLGEEGFALTVSARRPEKLEQAAQQLRARGFEVLAQPANVAVEEDLINLVSAHRERYGRLDVLVNNAGVGVGAPVGEIQTKRVDLQLNVNLRAVIIAYRECLELLKAAGAEHGNALVVNTSSISGKRGQPWLSVYSATKHGVVGFTEAMNKELGTLGIKSTALCPGFVDTAMTDFVKEAVPPEKMIKPRDVAEAVRFLLRTSPNCVVPEIIFARPDEAF